MRSLVRGTLIIGCFGVVALAASMFLKSPEPMPEPTEAAPHARWSLAGELGVDRSEEVHARQTTDLLGCSDVATVIRMFRDRGLGVRPVDVFTATVGDVEVRHVVVWVDDEYTAESATEDFVNLLDACVADADDLRKTKGVWTFERTGSVEEQRFGWYESTERPPGLEDAVAPTPSVSPSVSAVEGPYQSAGQYAFVDGWILVGVEASSENPDIDVRDEVDLDALLDVLVAKVDADPPTVEEWEEATGTERRTPPPLPSPTPSPTDTDATREASG